MKLGNRPCAEEVAALRACEAELAKAPTIEAYLDLAERYRAAGLHKDAQRLLQMSEGLEEKSRPSRLIDSKLRSGAIPETSCLALLDGLHRSRVTGELVVANQSDLVHVFFQNGEVINATSATQPAGFRSFLLATRIVEGKYNFLEKDVSRIDRLLVGNLAMEALRSLNRPQTTQTATS